MAKLQSVFLLKFDQEDAGRYVVGVFSSKKKAEQELEAIVQEYIQYNEMYNVTRDDALGYFNPEIEEFVVDSMGEAK